MNNKKNMKNCLALLLVLLSALLLRNCRWSGKDQNHYRY
jgi:hypothetical protein